MKKILTILVLAGLIMTISGGTSFAATTSDLQKQIEALMAQISSLNTQLGVTATTTSQNSGSQTTGITFNRNLSLGSQGDDVLNLQKFLSFAGLYSGPITGKYLSLTQKGVVQFQKGQHISPASGYFGPSTRAKLNELLKSQLQEAQKRATYANSAVTNQQQQATSSTATTTTVQEPIQQEEQLPPVKTINSRSIVGLVCYYDYNFINPVTYETVRGNVMLGKGSGVIIDPRGYILTNKHVIADSQDIESIKIGTRAYDVSVTYKFEHCDVGQVSAQTTLPSIENIKISNPFVQIPYLAYTATKLYLPATDNLSDYEAKWLDFALLKITGVGPDGPTFGIYSLPSSFDYAETLSNAPIKKGDEVVTYGYPGNETNAQGSAFQTLYMQGMVGPFEGLAGGDAMFNNFPLTVDIGMDIKEGRSGSPLFWRGYVIGIIRSYHVGVANEAQAVSIDAIQKQIKEGVNVW